MRYNKSPDQRPILGGFLAGVKPQGFQIERTRPSNIEQKGNNIFYSNEPIWTGVPEPTPPQYGQSSAKRTTNSVNAPAQTRPVDDTMQASIERIRARKNLMNQTESSTQAQIDDFMKGTMQDPRYWHPEHKDDAYRDGVTKLWQIGYPGRNQPGSWGRNDTPAVDLNTLREESKRVLPPSRHQAPGQAQGQVLDQAQGQAQGQESGQTSGKNTPLPQNPNSSAPSTPEARNAFAKGIAEELGLIPKSQEPGVQVAQVAISALAIGAAGIAAYELGQELDDKYGEDLDRFFKDSWGEPANGQNSVTPADPLPNQTQSPADTPNLDDTPKGRPDQSEETLGGYSLTFPDGSKHKSFDTLPPSPDQSDILPQGTILNMKDDDGNPYNLKVSGAPKKIVDRYAKFVRKLPPETHRAIGRMISEDAYLSTKRNSKKDINNVTKPVKNNPTTEMYADMQYFVMDHGGRLDEIVNGKDEKTGQPLKQFEASNGTKITAREFSKSGEPTNQITITTISGRKHHLKFRYERAQK